jgi:hypothetical protein
VGEVLRHFSIERSWFSSAIAFENPHPENIPRGLV